MNELSIEIVYNCQIKDFYGSKTDVANFILENMQFDRVLIIGNKEDFFSNECDAGAMFLDKRLLSDIPSLIQIALDFTPLLIIIDFDLDNNSISSEIKKINDLHFPIILVRNCII